MSEKLQIVIPIAGLGTRLRPHTYIRPKPLLSVAGKPILTHIVDQLAGLPVEEVVFITGHLGEQVEDWAKTECPYPAKFVEQTELKGQAHAISLVREHLRRPTLIIFGDTIFEADLAQLAGTKADGVLFVKEVEDPRRFGVAVLDKDDTVQKLVEKPKDPTISNLAVVGIYYVRDPYALMRGIDRVIERGQQLGGEYYLADALQAMIEEGARFRTSGVSVWADCGTVDALLETNAHLLGNGHDRAPEGAQGAAIVPPVHVHPTAQIVGSVVGPNVSVGANARIERSVVADAIVGEHAVVENAALRHSLIGDHARVQGQASRLSVADHSEVRLG